MKKDMSRRRKAFGSDPEDLTEVSGPDEMPVDKALRHGEQLGEILGSTTGEEDRDITAGGWEGTDDATSTGVSDLSYPTPKHQEEPDALTGRAFGGGLAEEDGGVSDITGSPVEDSRDWADEPKEK